MHASSTTQPLLDLAGGAPHDPAMDGMLHLFAGIEPGELVSIRQPGIERRRAVQEVLGRQVMVLQPVPHAAAAVHDELRAEARLLARLDHPNILPIHGLIDDGDRLQMLVASVDGDTWERRLSQPHVLRESFGATDVLAWHVRVLLDVCRAVQFTHAHGYLHRNLCPDSVWIGDLGEVYVIDWAQAVPQRAALPLSDRSRQHLRSASYQPPEMVLRSAGRVGVRTDVYQLGGLLYRILTGHPPHGDHDDIDDIIRNVLFRDPPIPHDAPPPLARVCKRALSRNPEARYADVPAFSRALEGALAQRGAWTVAARADAHFDSLQRLLRAPVVDTAAVYRTFGALRLGYQQAMADAPELQAARMRLDRATELVVQHLIAQRDIAAADAVLATLTQPPEHLRADIDEALLVAEAPSRTEERLEAAGRARDPHRDGGRRAWLAAVLTLLWIPAPLAQPVFGDTPYTPIGMVLTCFALSVAAAVISRATGTHRASSRLTRDLAGWSIWGTATTGALLAIGMLAGIDPDQLRTLVGASTLLVVGTAAFSVDGRLVVAGMAFGVATVASIAMPWTWAGGMFCANLVLASVLMVRPPREVRDGSRT